MKIKIVTVTGADESVTPQQMVDVQQKFPNVEWGILLSESSEGKSRFPKLEWIESLKELGLNLSGHLCGRWVRDVIKGDDSFWRDRPTICSMFDRIQLNFHSYLHRVKQPAFTDCLKSIIEKHNAPSQWIFQLDDVNNEILSVAQEAGIDAAGLFDTSGGVGRLPDSWPEAKRFCGYAGGLSPENLEEQLQSISEVAGDNTIWIDAETRLRTDDDSQFVMSKVERFLEIANDSSFG